MSIEQNIVISDAGKRDAEELLALQKLAFRSQGELYNDPFLPPLVQNREELEMEFGTHVVLKAMRDGRIIGSVRGRLEAGTCRISRLFVHPDHQGRGIGRKLMQEVEERFRGALRYELFTGHKSAKSLALYAQLGYRKESESPQSASVMLIYMAKQGHVR